MENRRSALLGLGCCFALLCGHVQAAHVLDDTLQGNTIGNHSGGSFLADGWKVIRTNDCIIRHVPTISRSSDFANFLPCTLGAQVVPGC